MIVVVPMLEDSLVWSTTGHLAEVAIAALADGESALLPQHAVQHALTCVACCEQVGVAALFALEVAHVAREAALALEPKLAAQTVLGSTLAARRNTNGKVRAPAPLAPLTMMMSALFVLLSLAAGAPLLSTLRESSPAHLLARLARIIAQATLAARAPGVAELTWLAAGLLVSAGLLIARSAARVGPRVSAGLP